MKNIFGKLALLVLSVSLVACSTNTQSTNTGIGAGTGAVLGGLAGTLVGQGTGRVVAVGVGAIAGALLGGTIGKNMDSSDKQNTTNAMDNNKPYQSSSWNNKTTGAKYKVKPTSTMMTYNGNDHCRKFHSIGYLNGEKQHVDGIACRQSNGNWTPIQA